MVFSIVSCYIVSLILLSFTTFNGKVGFLWFLSVLGSTFNENYHLYIKLGHSEEYKM
jgi:hypothetical protein